MNIEEILVGILAFEKETEGLLIEIIKGRLA
jgi:hypothetical protein